MRFRRYLIVSAAVLIVSPVAIVLTADRIGVDIGLVIDRFLNAPSGDGNGGEIGRSIASAPEAPDEAKEEKAANEGELLRETEAVPQEQAETDSEDKQPAEHGEETGEDFSEPITAGDLDFYRLPTGEQQPWRQFRQLQRMQDDVVYGKPGALEEYRKALERMGTRYLELPAAAWGHPRNVLAAANFVLSGGKPEIATRLLVDFPVEGRSGRILRGAEAFALGRYHQAYNLLYDIDPSELPPSIGGQLALVRAMLASPRDLQQARYFLTLARRLAPGTLTEEAALRRQLQVLTEARDDEAFFRAARAYMHHFPQSHYLADFLRSFASGILRLFPDDADRAVMALDETAGTIDRNARLYLYTLLARGATVFGQLELAVMASEKSIELANPGSRLAERLKLYKAAASLPAGKIGESVATLEMLDKEMLGTEDRRLLAAARLVAEQIGGPFFTDMFQLPDDAKPADERSEAVPEPDEATAEFPVAIQRAEQAMRSADEILGW